MNRNEFFNELEAKLKEAGIEETTEITADDYTEAIRDAVDELCTTIEEGDEESDDQESK